MARGVRQNLIDKRFGKLVVKEYKGTDNYRNGLWLCKCDCGNVIIVKGTELTKGNVEKGRIVSCGICSNKYDTTLEPIEVGIDKSLINQRFGKLVIKDIFLKDLGNNQSQMYALCKCDCGNTKEIKLINLKNGETLSCGCLQKEKMKKSKFRLSDDFIGQRFGKLVVLGFDDEQHKWKCKCDCGNIKFLTKGNLTNNGYKSCGNCFGKKTRNRTK